MRGVKGEEGDKGDCPLETEREGGLVCKFVSEMKSIYKSASPACVQSSFPSSDDL